MVKAVHLRDFPNNLENEKLFIRSIVEMWLLQLETFSSFPPIENDLQSNVFVKYLHTSVLKVIGLM